MSNRISWEEQNLFWTSEEKFKKIQHLWLCLNNCYELRCFPRHHSLIIETGDVAKMTAPRLSFGQHWVPWKLWYGQVGGEGLKCTSRSHPSTELGRVQDLRLDPEARKRCQIPQYSHRLSRAQEDREISVMQLWKRQNGSNRGGISSRDKEALMP